MIEEAYRRGSVAALPAREALRVLALLTREGRMPLEPPDARPHDVLRAVLGNLPWDPPALERAVAWLLALPGDGIEAIHLGCCLRPAEAAGLLAPERLEDLLANLRGRCLPASDSETRSVQIWEGHAARLRGEGAPGASPASAAGLELARWRGNPPGARSDGARRSLAREAAMWDGGSRLLQALAWMEGLPPEEQTVLLLEKRDLLLRGVRSDGEPGLLLALQGPVARGVAGFWKTVLQEEPGLLEGVPFAHLAGPVPHPPNPAPWTAS